MSNLDIVSDGPAYSFTDLETKNRNFYVPTCRILADGEDIFTKSMMISSLTVDHSVSKAGSCSLTAVPVPGEWDKKAPEQILSPGTLVEVYMGYAKALEAVFTGVVTRVGIAFTSSGAPELTVGCTDFSHLMMRGTEEHMWSKDECASFSEVVDKILSKYLDGDRLTTSVVEDVKTEQEPPFAQHGQSDYQFIKSAADQNHIDFFVSGPNVYFQKRQTTGEPVVELTWGKNLAGFRCDVDAASLVSSIKVTERGMEKEPSSVELDIGDIQEQICGDKMFGYVQKMYNDKSRLTVSTYFGDVERAKKYAEDVLIGRNKVAFSASGDCVGIPQIMAGRIIAIKGVGDLLSGNYFVTDVKHTLNTSGYKTGFTVTDC